MIKGGYGGGGNTFNYWMSESNFGAGSGGGQTAVKFLQNDLWHRVIVSGAGGGSDNSIDNEVFNGTDDGSGGAGGGLVGQGYWMNGVYQSDRLANSTYGFTFGFGESAQKDRSLNPDGVIPAEGGYDRPGAGAGWFGGFAGQKGNAGSGGGSSWALCSDAIIPKGNIYANGTFYNETQNFPYAFKLTDGYVFRNVKTASGVWEGNGRLIITVLENFLVLSCQLRSNFKLIYDALFVILTQTN